MYVVPRRVRSKSVQPQKRLVNTKSNASTKTNTVKSKLNQRDSTHSKKIIQQDESDIQNSLGEINKEKIEINFPDFSKLLDLEKKNNLKFIVCADTTDIYHQNIKYNWFDSSHQAKEIYDFFFPEKDCQVFWIDENEVKYLDPENKILQIPHNRALIFPSKTKE